VPPVSGKSLVARQTPSVELIIVGFALVFQVLARDFARLKKP
jgi:hypothetical protein